VLNSLLHGAQASAILALLPLMVGHLKMNWGGQGRGRLIQSRQPVFATSFGQSCSLPWVLEKGKVFPVS